MENRTITVKGVGYANARADRVELSFELETRNPDYTKAMELASERIDRLTEVITRLGNRKEELKTTGFRVDTDYRPEVDKNGRHHSVFCGYQVQHSLRMTIPFDTARLGETLGALAACPAKPEISIRFTVSDPEALKEQALRTAAENARRRAGILAAASGERLGKLLSVDYSWGELNIYSRTNFALADNALLPGCSPCPELEPEEIDLRDSVTFCWELA